MTVNHEVNVRITILGLEWLEPLVAQINWKLKQLKMTQDELVQQLKDDSAKIIKIGTETRTLVTKVADLIELIDKGEVKPELAEAATDVQAQLNIVDDLVPDAPAPEPPPAP